MKIKFSSGDSIYKIFSTIQKLLPWKKVFITIEEGNPIFDNIWRGLQLKEILQNNRVPYTFIAQSPTQKKYFEEAGLNYTFGESKSEGFLAKLNKKLGERKIPTFNLPVKNKYRLYLIVGLEILLVFFVLKYFLGILNTAAYVYVRPSFEVKEYVYPFVFYKHNLNIDRYIADQDIIYMPYFTGSTQKRIELSLPVADVRYINRRAQWTIKILNYTPRQYPLRATTRFVTKDWIVFRTKHWVNIPPAQDWKPGVAYAEVIADEYDENGQIVGARGNIGTWEELYIKNLKVSFFDKKIVAYPTKPFQWWETQAQWTVTTWDIQNLRQAILQKFEKDFPKILRQIKAQQPGKILLPPELATGKLVSWQISTPVGSSGGKVAWAGVFEITYAYVNEEDFSTAVDKYFVQRPFEGLKMIKVLTWDIQFLQIIPWSQKFDLPPWSIFKIVTNFKVVAGYIFDTDINLLKEEIKSKIVGKDKQEAIKIIRSYPQVNSVWIKISPPWYDKLPQLKSRIYFRPQN